VLVARFNNPAILEPNPDGQLGHVPAGRIWTPLEWNAQARARAGDAVVMLRGRGD
jgi:hypothetical protein